MSSFDNEIYRGPPEAGPTLEHDIRSYGSDVYIVKAEKNTLAQDVPPTEEPVRQEAKPVQKKESKIAKAMKLLASCTAAVAVAATLTAPAPAKPVDDGLAMWPWFGPVHDSIGGLAFDAISQHSDVCQVSIGGKSFRLEAQQEGIHLQWHETYDPSEDGSKGGFYICMENVPEDWCMILDFSARPQQKSEDSEGLCQFTTATGDTLYVRGFFIGSEDRSAQETMDQLGKYIRITKPTSDGWGKVLIGDTMYSDTNRSWNGTHSIDSYREQINYWHFYTICSTDIANYDLDDLICRHRVNGIDWSFYCAIEKGEFLLWAVPSQENIAFAVDITYLLYNNGFDPDAQAEMSGAELDAVASELGVVLRSYLLDFIENSLISRGLQYYHLVDRPTQNAPAEDVQQSPIAAGWNTSRTYPNFFSIQPGYENHGRCLFQAGNTTYLASPMKEDYYLFWQETIYSTQPAEYGYDEPYEYRSTTIILYNARDQWQAGLVFLLQPPDEGSGLPTMATYEASDGQLFYLVAIDCTDEDLTRERYREIASIADDLSSHLRIQVMDSGSWAHLRLGDHLISDITPVWTGLATVKHADYSGYRGVNMNWNIAQIRYTNSIDFQKLQSLRSQEVNGIEWTFYAPANSPDFGYDEDYLWAVPSHGDMSFGIDIHGLLRSMFGDGDYLWNALQENPYLVTDALPEIIDMVIEDGLIHIYPIGQSAPPQPDYTEEEDFYHRVDFTLNGRSFQMDSMRDDTSFRLVREDNDSAVIDLRIADDDITVRMKWATIPTEKDQYLYTVGTGGELFFSLHNLDGARQLSDEELARLADEISFYGDYLHITEHATEVPTTAVPETEPTLPEPYPEMEEYIRYDISYDVGLHHTEFARSNRVCQFVTQYGAYRLQALEPELFINWEDYYYDIKDDSANSLVTFSHYEEGWKLGAWVFDEQVDSIYQSFSLRTNSGKELWFYADPNNSNVPETEFVAVIDRIFQLATLSEAQEDGWGKVRIGQTLISHNNQYWNGFAYTSGSDYWYFAQILDSHALSGYDLRHAGTRYVNGIQWDFYTLGGPADYIADGVSFYYTNVYAVCSLEDLWLVTSLTYGLSLDHANFASQDEYHAYIAANIEPIVDMIANQGLSNYYPYP